MLSAIVITKNEEEMIGDCLKSLQFADEIIVVDTGNTDSTNLISKKYGARIVKSHGEDYSQFRNAGMKAAKGDWLLYIDADERVTPQLRNDILSVIRAPVTPVYAIPRKNIYLGKPMRFGGWGQDYVIRLFKSSALTSWYQPLHEQPRFFGNLSKLHNLLLHYSHRDLSSMLEKTLHFTEYEAQLRFDAHHPPVTWWRILRMMATEFWYRFIKLFAAGDGPRGIIDGMFQVFNMFIIYARLWEKQLSKSTTR